MKRWAPRLIRICVFLLLGAIVNVAVAWGLVWWSVPTYSRIESVPPTSLWPFIQIPSECTSVPQTVAHFGCFGVSEQCIMFRTNPSDPFGVQLGDVFKNETTSGSPMLYLAQQVSNGSRWGVASGQIPPLLSVSAGWPARTLQGQGDTSEQRLPVMSQHALPSASALQRVVNGRKITRLLPYTPIWPGFAINTLFYAAILWLMFAAPFALRRWRRVKRGLCPACAYPVGASDVCTECGKPVRPKEITP